MTLTGTGSISAGSKIIHGTGTLFTSELAEGDSVTLDTYTGIVDRITDDLTAKCKVAATATVTNATITKN